MANLNLDRRSVAASLLGLLAAGCGRPEDKIVGKWSNGRTGFEFLRNGTFLLLGTGQSLSGTWNLAEDGRVVMIVKHPGGEIVIDGSVAQNTLYTSSVVDGRKVSGQYKRER